MKIHKKLGTFLSLALLVSITNNYAMNDDQQNNTTVSSAEKVLLNQQLLTAINQHNSELAQTLLEAQADVDSQDEYKNTALMKAVKFDDFPCAKLLIAHNANIYASNDTGTSITGMAFAYNRINIIKILIAAGLVINQAHCDAGRTPLTTAIQKYGWIDNDNIISMLLVAGADIRYPDTNDHTPLKLLFSDSTQKDNLIEKLTLAHHIITDIEQFKIIAAEFIPSYCPLPESIASFITDYLIPYRIPLDKNELLNQVIKKQVAQHIKIITTQRALLENILKKYDRTCWPFDLLNFLFSHKNFL